jgi:hypothetical protein
MCPTNTETKWLGLHSLVIVDERYLGATRSQVGVSETLFSVTEPDALEVD